MSTKTNSFLNAMSHNDQIFVDEESVKLKNSNRKKKIACYTFGCITLFGVLIGFFFHKLFAP